MIINLGILYTIVSIYLIKDLFSTNRFANQASAVVSFTALLWWLVNCSSYFKPYMLEASSSIAVGAIYFIYLLSFDSLNSLNLTVRRVIANLIFFCWLFFLFQALYIFLFNRLFVDFLFLKSIIFGLIFFIMALYLKYLKISIIPSLWQRIGLEWGFILTYLFIHIYLFFFQHSYDTSLRFYFFYILYFLFYGPYFIRYPLRTFRLYIHSFFFTLLFLLFGFVYVYSYQFILFPALEVPFQWFYYFLSPIFLVLFFYTFDRFANLINQKSPFSVIDFSQFTIFVDLLKSISKRNDLKQLLSNYSIFKSTQYSIHLWNLHDDKRCYPITSLTPVLDNEIVLFLQYKEVVYVHDLDMLLIQYSQTPFQSNVRLLYNFMQTYSLIKISLLQKSREMVGVFALSFKDSRKEILSFDRQQFQLLENVLSNTLCNTNSVLRLLNHQKILEHINIASSKFNVSIDDETYYAIIRKTLIKIIPEIKFYFLLKYDPDSQFYKRSFLLTKDYEQQTMKIHANVIESALKDNMYVKYSLTQSDTPTEFQHVMTNIGVNHLLLIRLSESSGSSIFVLFFNSNIDILDYRISFCQMFLRQSDIFYQYQANCEELNRLQLFLKRLLDQLPTGILITNTNFELKYINSKMNDQLDKDLINYPNKDIRELGVLVEIIDAIDHVTGSESDYVKKVELPLNQKNELYLLSSFKVLQDQEPSIIVVLTNIQQSKELIDQMNQTNRLAMMSKIAKGISYELSKPVDQLINGVEQIESRWSEMDFQDYFSTDIVPQVDRINLLCQSLLRLSRSNTESLVEVFLPDLLDQVLRLIAGDLRYTTQKFYVGVLDRQWIIVDQVMAIQVLMNLMIFCLKSLASEDSRLSLDIVIADNNMLSIKIGIKHFINGSFSNEDDMKDQLELSIVNQIVMNQNGQFDIFCEHQLASFHIMLPIKKLSVATSSSS